MQDLRQTMATILQEYINTILFLLDFLTYFFDKGNKYFSMSSTILVSSNLKLYYNLVDFEKHALVKRF